MKPFAKHTGKVAALDRANVDADQVIPNQFLDRMEREFSRWRAPS
jgi:3-isopropylmalate/(R)-2-methylmalate dehydratase small subunit